MNIKIRKTYEEIGQKLIKNDFKIVYELSKKFICQLIGILYEQEFGFGSSEASAMAENADGKTSNDTVTLTINEPLPSMKELTSAVQDYWTELIHIAIKKASKGKKLPYFEKAFVWIEVTTPRFSDNTKLWDTSNRAINLIINNLKGIFFKDDNHEHLAFGVLGKWGAEGKTEIKIMPLEGFTELIKN